MATNDALPPSMRPPPGIPQIVPNSSWPHGIENASGVADCISHPVVAQFTFDCLTMLVEACRRERFKNYESIRNFPAQGPPFIGQFDEHDDEDFGSLVSGTDDFTDSMSATGTGGQHSAKTTSSHAAGTAGAAQGPDLTKFSTMKDIEGLLTVVQNAGDEPTPLEPGRRATIATRHPEAKFHGKSGTVLELKGNKCSFLLDSNPGSTMLVSTENVDMLPMVPAELILQKQLNFEKPSKKGNKQWKVQGQQETTSLKGVAHFMKAYDTCTLLVEAFADDGDKDMPGALRAAQGRAVAIKAVLVEESIREARITAVGLPANINTSGSNTSFKIMAF